MSSCPIKSPDNVEIDKNGFMSVWYLDGNDETLNIPTKEKNYTTSSLLKN